MGKQIVIIGPSSQKLAYMVAKRLDAQPYTTEAKVFPDGECYLRIEIEKDELIQGKDVIIIQTTGGSSGGNQNQRLMELIMMISAVKRMGAARIRVVNPYFAYSRQDKAFRPGEAIFAEDICRWIQAAGATEFYTIDMHAPKVLEAFTIPTYNLDPMKILASEVKKLGINAPVVLCPDKGAYERSRDFAKYLGENIPVEQLEKKRDVKTGEITMGGNLNVKDKDIIVADDIIATGGTMANSIEIAKKAGAKSVIVVGTHPLLIKNAVFKLMASGTDIIFGTDTLDSIAMQASMAEIIVEAIKNH
jgi:ribose-phosphate pyrophosphokinase